MFLVLGSTFIDFLSLRTLNELFNSFLVKLAFLKCLLGDSYIFSRLLRQIQWNWGGKGVVFFIIFFFRVLVFCLGKFQH